jgi:hypothetical protein
VEKSGEYVARGRNRQLRHHAADRSTMVAAMSDDMGKHLLAGHAATVTVVDDLIIEIHEHDQTHLLELDELADKARCGHIAGTKSGSS